MASSAYRGYSLNLQGYSGLSEEAQRRLDLALRFKPGLCTAVALVALVTGSPPVALIGSLLGFWAAFLPHHPFDLLYRAVQRPLGMPELGPDPAPRRFACGMAATLLLLGALAWLGGATVLGTVLVGMTVAALLLLVVSGFCLGSFVYWLIVRRQIFRGA